MAKDLLRRAQIAPIKGAFGVFAITVPFARLLPVYSELVLTESHPLAALSHRTALIRHGLSNWVPTEVHISQFTPPDPQGIPLGTTPEDWVGLPPLKFRTPGAVADTRVQWVRTSGEWDFGIEIGWEGGLPVYQTDRERTLVDAMRSPSKVGGILELLDALDRSLDTLDLNRLVNYTERFESGVLRQRVGFLLESVGRTHPRFDRWRERLQRGSSLKLLPDAPFAGTFSARWNLSLNVPDAVLGRLNGTAVSDG